MLRFIVGYIQSLWMWIKFFMDDILTCWGAFRK